MDWEASALGPLEAWPVELVASLNLILASRLPMFMAWGPDGALLYNDAWAPTIAGKGDCVGQRFMDVFKEAKAGIGPLYARAARGDALHVEDFPVPLARHGRLSATWWSFSYSPVMLADGSVGGVFGVGYETTRRLLAEQALASSEAALRAVTNSAPILLWRCASDGLLTWTNQQLSDLVGNIGEAPAYWDDRVHPEDIELGHRVHDECAISGRPFECQQRVRGTDDAYRWFTVRAQQIVDASGRVTGWIGSAIDIDDWRAAFDKAQTRDELFRAYSSSDATLKWVADVEARTAEALNDPGGIWPRPAGSGPLSWDDWLAHAHPDDQPKFAAMIRTAIGGEVTQTTVRGLPIDGAVRCYQVTVFPIADEQGNVHRLGGLTLDITGEQHLLIYLVDADPVRRQRLARDLGQMQAKVRAFDSTASFESVIDDLRPGCVILTSGPDREETLRTAARLRDMRRHFPWIATGALAGEMQLVVQFMKLGASDAIDESKGAFALVAAAAAAMSVAPAAPPPTDEAASARKRLASLTDRERQVLSGLMSGLTNKEIAKDLSLSPRTVETHRAHLMDRSGAGTLAELLRFASLAGTEAEP